MNNEAPTPRKRSLPARILSFYVDGFRQMTVGRTLWIMILIKLFIIFFVFKLFFFPDILKRDYDNDGDRADAVRRSMLAPERIAPSSSSPEHSSSPSSSSTSSSSAE